MRKLGLDVGDVRIGVSMSDMLGMIANTLETYKRLTIEEDIAHFDKLVKEHGIDTIVVGLPLNMDGTSGPRVEATKAYVEKLQEQISNVKWAYQDERLTTVAAEKMLISADVRRDKRKQVVDKIAACLILQAYLDRH